MNPPAWPKPVKTTEPQTSPRSEGSLGLRKRLLIVESELNRAQLVQEWHAMADDARSLTHRVKTIGSFASVAGTLAAGLSSFCRKKSAPADEKPSWIKTVFKGAQLAGSLWSEFRARPKS